jgi:hypothetical protein
MEKNTYKGHRQNILSSYFSGFSAALKALLLLLGDYSVVHPYWSVVLPIIDFLASAERLRSVDRLPTSSFFNSWYTNTRARIFLEVMIPHSAAHEGR